MELYENHAGVAELHIPSSSRGIQAILAGEIAFSLMDGANAADRITPLLRPNAQDSMLTD
jgi:hypothetical protein